MGGSVPPETLEDGFFPRRLRRLLAPLRFKKAVRSGPPLPLRPWRVQAVRTAITVSHRRGMVPGDSKKETSK